MIPASSAHSARLSRRRRQADGSLRRSAALGERMRCSRSRRARPRRQVVGLDRDLGGGSGRFGYGGPASRATTPYGTPMIAYVRKSGHPSMSAVRTCSLALLRSCVAVLQNLGTSVPRSEPVSETTNNLIYEARRITLLVTSSFAGAGRVARTGLRARPTAGPARSRSCSTPACRRGAGTGRGPHRRS